MQTRHSPITLGLRLPTHLTIWQQIIIWSSLLFSSPSWSTPKPFAGSDPHASPIAIQRSSLAVSPRSKAFQTDRSSADLPLANLPPATPRSDRPSAQRHRAAALLPLQPVQGEAVATTAATVAFSAPAMAMTIEGAIAPSIAQSNTLPVRSGDNDAPASVIRDPELGVLRLQVPPAQLDAPTAADWLGQSQIQAQTQCASGAALDPELGCLPLQPLPPPPPRRQPVVYLLGRVDYFRSSNVFAAVDPVDDGLIRPGVTLFTAPALGRNTYFVGTIDANLIRYNTQSQIDYNELRFRAGILQRLSPTMFGELGWSNQQLLIAGDKIPGLPAGTRFLNDHALRFELSRRDQLNKRLALNTFYQLRLSFADPDSRSRLLNSFIASLSYDVQSNLQVGLDYQFALANFTAVKRDDLYHQIAARLTYTAFRNTQLNVFVGYSFGSSTDPLIEFNSLILGVSLTVSLGLF